LLQELSFMRSQDRPSSTIFLILLFKLSAHWGIQRIWYCRWGGIRKACGGKEEEGWLRCWWRFVDTLELLMTFNFILTTWIRGTWLPGRRRGTSWCCRGRSWRSNFQCLCLIDWRPLIYISAQHDSHGVEGGSDARALKKARRLNQANASAVTQKTTMFNFLHAGPSSIHRSSAAMESSGNVSSLQHSIPLI